MLIRVIHFIFLILTSASLASCTGKYSVDSYKQISRTLRKDYKIGRADLVLEYDLASIDNSNCIFAKDFGLFANEKTYAQRYLNKFRAKHPSSEHFSEEAKIKIRKILSLLLELQNKYQFLSNSNYQRVKALSRADSIKMDPKQELAHLDEISAHLPLMMPSYNPYISSRYGNRKHPSNGQYKMHCGIDLAAKNMAPIYASARGKVSFVGKQKHYGLLVEIDHGKGFKTRYAHLKQTFVHNRQKVIRGEVIGLQGSSGNAKGEHLHFEIHNYGKHLDPYDFIGHNYEC